MWQPGSPGEKQPKGPGKIAKKVGLNLKEGTAKKGGHTSVKLVAAQQAILGKAPWA